MLTARHRELLKQKPYEVHVWHVEQYEHEAVWIPGGCAHQVGVLGTAFTGYLDCRTVSAQLQAPPARKCSIPCISHARVLATPPGLSPLDRCATCAAPSRWRSTLCRPMPCTSAWSCGASLGEWAQSFMSVFWSDALGWKSGVRGAARHCNAYFNESQPPPNTALLLHLLFRQGAKKELQLWQADHPGQQEEDVGSRHFADKLQAG